MVMFNVKFSMLNARWFSRHILSAYFFSPIKQSSLNLQHFHF